MSYLENTPFSPSPSTLSPEAAENRKRLILIWKIQTAQLDTLKADLLDPTTMLEENLIGEDFDNALRTMLRWNQMTALLPVFKMEKLEALAKVPPFLDHPTNNPTH